MLKWERGEAGSWVGRADGFEYRTVVDFFDSECAQQKAEFQVRHDARIASIAAANGYVKLGDDEIVVKRDTLNALIDDHCADCTFDSLEIHDCDNCDLKPIRDRLKSEEGK